ncbi:MULTISPECIES: hypothetical protein [unclassified Microcoleus]|uniref:hypothetical protein n=1 Tax=unclassified Microcoleus TaxID=2642155 RepID=UPI001DD3B535|nr:MULTISPECIES: hypothetical protein [unclassified Microcoleus]MCC3420646.1 hypothetical protein [Microcoleus sp. PH2017_07_MST_O_A]MCC3468838.1 hypothetical protein [Microcoleus sp. PH2017_06_SFM_O_A]MCC3505340.1 hypothetical protein [Microcoleus sp. PH2017_19_SFW_U_A]MCC3510589.1 hypothetical protein [Microcoleus sp. PH2017_17_BER_D_A]MCC3413173.1 hypothetical protein [Microcoleus sp. PH2017_02_FOX_O_A]
MKKTQAVRRRSAKTEKEHRRQDFSPVSALHKSDLHVLLKTIIARSGQLNYSYAPS